MNHLRLGLVTLLAASLLGVASAEPLLIAQLQPGADPIAVALADGVILRDVTPNAPFALYGIPVGSSLTDAQLRMQADPMVLWAEDDADISPPENQGFPKKNPSKGGSLSVIGGRQTLQTMNANALAQVGWSSTLANSPGRPVRIAILDTGLSVRQTYLWDKVDASFSAIPPFDSADDSARYTGGENAIPLAAGHGTMVAGVIDQVAPQVRFLIARVADGDGKASAWTLVKGLAFAVVNHAEVANISLGSPNAITALTDVEEWCDLNNLTVVAAIGNNAVEPALFPARITKVLCVGGLNADSTKAGFSNWDGGCDSSAPAVGICSQFWDGQIQVWSGTSFAAPFVSAAIADCLRRTTPTAPRVVSQLTTVSGGNLDRLNPAYRRKLGTLLNIQRLDAAFQGGHGG